MTVDFGLLRAIDVQSFGQPGQRTFRLRLIGADGDTASTWLEKEQMQALSLALKQMMSQLEYDTEPPPADVGEFPPVASQDFRVGRMGMGFNSADRTVTLYLYEAGLDEDDEATLHARMTQEQCAALGVSLDEIIGGGRPMCPLCGAPMDSSGHMCVRTNGHSNQPIPDSDVEDEPADEDEP